MDIQLPDNHNNFVTIEPAAMVAELSELDEQTIIGLYKKYGALLFRGFPLDLERFALFTSRFCSGYVTNESGGRTKMSADGRIQTVNLGYGHFPLHPELSRLPWQPDVAWFACDRPARIRGETTVCDGVAVANAFPPELLSHLQSNSLEHREPVSTDWCRRFLQVPDLSPGILETHSDDALFRFERSAGELFRTYVRPMLHKPMFTNSLAYGNFLVFARQQLMVRNFPTYIGGTEIPDELVQEIAGITNDLAVPLQWRSGDLLMLDNTRFMHGRNPIGDPKVRRIYTQFGYISFAPADFPNIDKHPWRATNGGSKAFDERFV